MYHTNFNLRQKDLQNRMWRIFTFRRFLNFVFSNLLKKVLFIFTNTCLLRVFKAKNYTIYFLLMGHPRTLLIYFCLFKQTLQFLQQIYVKMLCPSKLWCRDLNPQPSEHGSSPITTRLGFPPFTYAL